MNPVSPEISALVPVIAKAFAHGRVVPFLGAGASLLGRKDGFAPGTSFPTGGELADSPAWWNSQHPSEPPSASPTTGSAG